MVSNVRLFPSVSFLLLGEMRKYYSLVFSNVRHIVVFCSKVSVTFCCLGRCENNISFVFRNVPSYFVPFVPKCPFVLDWGTREIVCVLKRPSCFADSVLKCPFVICTVVFILINECPWRCAPLGYEDCLVVVLKCLSCFCSCFSS